MNKALGYNLRIPMDIDIIAYPDELNEIINLYGQYTTRWNDGNKSLLIYGTRANPRRIIEIEFAIEGSSAGQLLQYATKHCVFEDGVYYASIDILYMIKMSHRFLKNSPSFNKTMNDIRFLRDTCKATIPQDLMECYHKREEETYTYNHPSLNQTKKDFFSDDGVKYVYDHDSIHEVMKQGEYPAYTYFKYPNEEVRCSRELFEQQPMEVRLNAVLEETYVLALERSQIPFKDEYIPWSNSFKMALEKVCTSITSGWFRDFAWENYDNVLSMYDETYVQKFWDAVNEGKVKEIEYV